MTAPQTKLPPAEWLDFFVKANVLTDRLDATNNTRGRSIRIGTFLTNNVGREVPIEVKGRIGRAVLRVCKTGHAKCKAYFFEVTWDSAVEKPRDANKTITDKPKPAKKSLGTPPRRKPERKPPAKVSKPENEAQGNDEVWE